MAFFKLLRDLLVIVKWREFWIVVSAPAIIVGFWFLFCFLLSIPNPAVRAMSIWSLIIGLSLAGGVTERLRKEPK